MCGALGLVYRQTGLSIFFYLVSEEKYILFGHMKSEEFAKTVSWVRLCYVCDCVMLCVDVLVLAWSGLWFTVALYGN